MQIPEEINIVAMVKIIRNVIKCKKCGDVIESYSAHDFKFCSCESCAVDGGHDYLRRCGNREDFEAADRYGRLLFTYLLFLGM